ncbi:cell division cycle protein 23 homolog [Condylostylus longicornis]|uniref:cell division cycle protein 23 homolog n=1 Tax=Condylostylus longicornis TaxID=2530218 RepID=UPI00244DF111|nr:cell division cycle protein 23 homolog [Condylostylus longicornis]
MYESIYNIRLPEVKQDLCIAIIECNKRGLLHCSKWLAELNHGLCDIEISKDFTKNMMSEISDEDYDNYCVAKSYYDTREYDRAAYFTRNCSSPVPKFLHYYCTYMAKEKKRLDNITDASNLNNTKQDKGFSDLYSILKSEYNKKSLDGYCLYLYGIVLKNLNLNQAATKVLIECIQTTPMLWSAWIELAPLIADKEKLLSLNLPNHWMKQIFLGHAYIELYLNDEGFKQFEALEAIGFEKCTYILSQIAIAYHNKRDVDKAIETFQMLQEADPYRLDNLDTFSNLLFVKDLKTEMASLAHKAVEINKYRPETCCVIGNYYSIRCEHQKAITYFQRALKLNPQYLSAWTLMGHEFMELKNTNAAIQSYRKAVEIYKRDYRAWYGLGQAYEILKMHYYSLYYFKIAHQLRPYDSRMLVALGETFEKLEKSANAIKCYEKACNVGDIEGVALFKLAYLHEKLGSIENAIPSYRSYCLDERATVDKQSLYHAYITLGNYYESKGNYDEASHFAYKCLDSEEKKSEAKALLKTIENKRAQNAAATQVITEKSINETDAGMNTSEMSFATPSRARPANEDTDIIRIHIEADWDSETDTGEKNNEDSMDISVSMD